LSVSALVGCRTSALEESLRILNQRAILFSFLEEHSDLGTRPAAEAVFFDFDHTLADTQTTIPVDTEYGTEQRDSKCFFLRAGERPHFEALSPQELARTGPIDSMVQIARQLEARGDLLFIVTARGESHTWNTIPLWLKKNGIKINGLVAANAKETVDGLKPLSRDTKLPHDFKKALIIAGWIELIQSKFPESPLKSVSYYEDTDHHLRGAMQLLPLAFPDIEFHFYDILRTQRSPGKYRLTPIANASHGTLDLPGDPAHYASPDCPDED
ncbi:MAG: hypothetical protein KDK37_19045, partial [Leptospiraceae bacterium]|nr:hypothetical protein [Leptospiraceae bacterium]